MATLVTTEHGSHCAFYECSFDWTGLPQLSSWADQVGIEYLLATLKWKTR